MTQHSLEEQKTIRNETLQIQKPSKTGLLGHFPLQEHV
jgi:hypothetical protein